MEEVFEEHLEGGCVGAEASNMKLQHGDDEEIPGNPSDIVRAKIDLPAVVCPHSTQCSCTIPNGEDTKERDLLSHWDAQVPVEEGRQDRSDQILNRRDDACREYVSAFVKAAVLISTEQELSVRLIPECGDGIASKYGHNGESDGGRGDESYRDPRGPAKAFRDNARGQTPEEKQNRDLDQTRCEGEDAQESKYIFARSDYNPGLHEQVEVPYVAIKAAFDRC